MRDFNWRLKLGGGLLASALLLFGGHYLVFRDFHHLAIFTWHELAFLPVEVLIVTMILHELLERRARQERLHKLNMVIGAFFSEAGADLLRLLENPNLLEHESFTDVLWSVFHLAEELEHRPDVTRLSKSDLAHLSGDMRRAYAALAAALMLVVAGRGGLTLGGKWIVEGAAVSAGVGSSLPQRVALPCAWGKW